MKTLGIVTSTAGLCWVLAASSAMGTDATSGSESANLEEIVVTAQRREENLSRTPVAVTVISGDALAKGAISSEADLQFAAPGLLVKTGQSANDQNYALRGQSLDAYSDTRPGVLPYFNEIQVGGAGTASAFYDLASVQVLKGPQGTLFGRNSTGGAVLFTTAKPTNDLGGYIDVGGGNFSTAKAEGAFNAPIIPDKLLFRIAGTYLSNDGTQENFYDGQRYGNFHRYGLRGSLTANITDTLTNDLVVDYYRSRGRTQSDVLYSLLPTGAVPVPFLYSPAFPGYPPYAATNPKYPAGGIAAVLAAQQASGPYNANSNVNNLNITNNIITSDVTTLTLNADTKIKNIFGLTNLRTFLTYDGDGTPFSINETDSGHGPLYDEYNTKQYSDELQLGGTAIDERLNYVTGIYYSKEEQNTSVSARFFDIFGGGAEQAHQTLAFQRKNTTYAGYGQGTYDLSSVTGVTGLKATAGARFTSEKVELKILPANINYDDAINNPTQFNNDQSVTSKNVSWTVGLQDQITPETLLYLTSRRSYKNAGFNGLVAPAVGTAEELGNRYKTESLTDAELGAKFEGSLVGIPTRVNVAIFNDWIAEDQRTAFVLTPAGVTAAITVNVPRSSVQGFEFDTQISPAEWLQLGAAANYLRARFTNNDTVVAGVTIPFDSYPDSPRWTGQLYSEVSHHLGNGLIGRFRAEIFSQTHTTFSSTANLNPDTVLPGYGIVDFRLGVDSDKNWSITANLKNAFNKGYYTGGIPIGELLGYNTAVPGTPRTILVEARYKF